MLRWLLALTIGSVLAFGGASSFAADSPIGAVTKLQGSATWRSGSALEPFSVGAPIFTNQKIVTGDAARLELTFDDGTKLTLGERTTMTLDTFVYDPAKGTGKLKLALVGALRFVSGKIGEQPDKEVAVETPVAVIGARGTDFFAGPIDGQALGVLLLQGSVVVTNAAGEQTLDQPGEGTNIAAPGAAPGPVTLWPADKVARALATVTFR